MIDRRTQDGATATNRILVTGASSFIGRHSVVPLLQRGYEVHLTVRGSSSRDFLEPDILARCRIHEVDLLDSRATERCVQNVRPSHLLHFAWHADISTRLSSPANLKWAAATLNLATNFVTAGGRRIVVCGTCAEYDWHFGTLSEDETPLSPATLYGAAKNSTHDLLRFAAPRLDVSLAWGRVFSCYGSSEPAGRLVVDVVTSLLAGRTVACSAGQQIRDYMFTEDIGCAFATLVDCGYDGAVNIGTGVPVRVSDLITTTAELIGRPDLIQLGARAPRPGEPGQLVADVTRLKEKVGYHPRTDLKTGLARTIEWYRNAAPR